MARAALVMTWAVPADASTAVRPGLPVRFGDGLGRVVDGAAVREQADAEEIGREGGDLDGCGADLKAQVGGRLLDDGRRAKRLKGLAGRGARDHELPEVRVVSHSAAPGRGLA